MNKIAIVTGASRGIGYELCKVFIDAGWRTIGLVRNLDNLNGLSGLELYKIDLAEPLNHLALIDDLKKEVDIDFIIVIHNAGVLKNLPFDKTTDEQIQTMLSVNFWAPLRLTRALLPDLKRSKAAHSIFIGSMAGVRGSVRFPGLSIYSSTKSALASLSESLAVEFQESKMRFNTLALGGVDTEMLQESIPGYHAGVTSMQMAKWIYTFAVESYPLINGKVIEVASADPAN